MIQKTDIRSQIRSLKKQFSTKELQDISYPIINKLLSNEKLMAAHTIMAYYSLTDEVYTHDLIDTLVRMQKKVLLPKVIGDGEMVLMEYKSKDDLRIGAYNILEPTGNLFNKYNEIDAIIVPGVAFDTNKNRCGRGKGFYDRFLSKITQNRTEKTYLIGLAFPFQILDYIPTDKHDIPMDTLIF